MPSPSTPAPAPNQPTAAYRFNRRTLVLPAMRTYAPQVITGTSGLQALGLTVACLYLFIILSRTFDVMFSALRIPMAFFLLSNFFAIISGNLLRVFQRRIAVILWLMIGWLGVTTVFSTHRGGSFGTWEASLLSCTTATMLMCLVTTSADALRLLKTFAYAALAAAVLGFIFGGAGDRLNLYQGTYGDPNQYAMGLLSGMPLFLYLGRRKSAVAKIFVYGGAAIMFVAFLRAGSRGGAIGLLAVAGIWFFQLSLPQKVAMATLGFVLMAGAMAFLPDYLKVRYTTFLSADQEKVAQLDEEAQAAVGGDVGSTEGRLQLLKDALILTAHHPLMGVGPRQFAMQRWEMNLKKLGRNTGYFVTHNSYTEMSSENGLPGLAILIALIVYTFKDINSVLKLRGSTEYKVPDIVIDAALGFRLTMIATVICAFFLSVAYSLMFLIPPALACAFAAGVRHDLPMWRVSDDDRKKEATAVPTVSPLAKFAPARA